jgi:hypothetical protein
MDHRYTVKKVAFEVLVPMQFGYLNFLCFLSQTSEVNRPEVRFLGFSLLASPVILLDANDHTTLLLAFEGRLSSAQMLIMLE